MSDPMTPEQIEEIVALIDQHIKTLPTHVMERYTTVLLRQSKRTITQLQEQNQNYQEQIKALVAEKYKYKKMDL